MTKISNVPDYAMTHKWVVYTDLGTDGKWFYGAYDDKDADTSMRAALHAMPERRLILTEDIERA